MAGASIPQGFFGGGSTGGSSIGFSGGQGLGGTQAAVTNPTDSSKLMAYDANTMATSLTPKAPLPQALGLAEGSVGTTGVTGANQSSAAGALFRPNKPVIPKVTTPTTTTKTTTPAATAATPKATTPGAGPLTFIPGTFGNPQGTVNDQYNPNTGSSGPVSSVPGIQNSANNMITPNLWYDAGTKTYYSDAYGKNKFDPSKFPGWEQRQNMYPGYFQK